MGVHPWSGQNLSVEEKISTIEKRKSTPFARPETSVIDIKISSS